MATEDTDGIIAAILTLAVIPQSAGGHDPKDVVQRYKEVSERLRAGGTWNHRGA